MGDRQWNIPALRSLLEEVLPKHTRVDDFKVEHVFPKIGKKTMLLNARRVEPAEGEEPLIVLSIAEVPHEAPCRPNPTRAALERKIESLEARNLELARTLQIVEQARANLADQYDYAPLGFVTLDAKGCIREINLTAARLLGRERSQFLTMPFLVCVAKVSLPGISCSI